MSATLTNGLECSATVAIRAGCKKFDEINFKCQECLETHYLSFVDLNTENSICCPKGEYYDLDLS